METRGGVRKGKKKRRRPKVSEEVGEKKKSWRHERINGCIEEGSGGKTGEVKRAS